MEESTHTTEPEWSIETLVKIIPFVATTFAVAYVVGYFSAFDISWLPMFSLSEHIVFAIRALPMAIGASVIFSIVLISPQFFHRFHGIATAIWILVLVCGAFYAFYRSYFGDAICFALMIMAAWAYHSIPPGRMSPNSFRRLLYWGATLSVMCIMLGWLSGVSSKYFLPRSWGHVLAPYLGQRQRTMFIGDLDSGKADTDLRKSIKGGHVIFAGDKDILFFEYQSGRTLLLEREKTLLFECPEDPLENESNPEECHRHAKRRLAIEPPL